MSLTNKKAYLCWSSGKDSAWALYMMQKSPGFEIVGLVTTVNQEYGRVAMHGVRKELLCKQANAIGLPLEIIPIPNQCTNEQYDTLMARFIENIKEEKIEHIVFGDIFLEDVRSYRETKLAGTGVEPLFPLWGISTPLLARDMIRGGLRAYITCVDPKRLSLGFAGREYDESFLNDIPRNADPCGENGEFHSFVFDGPMFLRPVDVARGQVLERDNFVFADLC